MSELAVPSGTYNTKGQHVIETIQPDNVDHWRVLRAKDVTSTTVAALYGCCPHTTEFELWHRVKEQTVIEIEPVERMKWGNRLQDSIAAGIAEDNKFQIRKMTEYLRDPEVGLGASFDFEIVDAGILEVKNVDALQFRDNWIVDGDNVEAPPHIELQVQTQLGLTGKSFALIGALVGGNRVVGIHRRPDPKIYADIRKRVAEFHLSIVKDEPPVPDYARDAALLMQIYGNATPGKVYDARNDSNVRAWCDEYRRLGEENKMADEARTALKMQILAHIGDAEKVVGDGFSITAGIVKGGPVSYERTDYRNFRINWKKGTK